MKTIHASEMDRLSGGDDTLCGIGAGIAAAGAVTANPFAFGFGVGFMLATCGASAT